MVKRIKASVERMKRNDLDINACDYKIFYMDRTICRERHINGRAGELYRAISEKMTGWDERDEDTYYDVFMNKNANITNVWNFTDGQIK